MKRGATREEIIRTTQELIARNGIRAVRVDEIAQMLGISKRTLYELFADKNDLVFPADTTGVSGVHCVVRLTSAGATLTDLGSSFGTFLNGSQKLTPHQSVELKPGDTFSLGSQRQKFRLERKHG